MITECPWCSGTGQNVVEHAVFGPEVTERPDCDGTGSLEDGPSSASETPHHQERANLATPPAERPSSRISGATPLTASTPENGDGT